ncbi:MAG: hypothetical protein KDJ73_11790 [Notoacmeibacter sp.]|nr:hypothetical protein [Notoacmeibacter sp.]
MIGARKFTVGVVRLLFAACFLLAGSLSVSASVHGGMVVPAVSALPSSTDAGAPDHREHHSSLTGEVKNDCHGQERPGEQEHKGSCCDATCFMALVLSLPQWTHVRPGDAYTVPGHDRVAGMDRMLLERPPKR